MLAAQHLVPASAVADAIAHLRAAREADWQSDLASAFRLRIDDAERECLGVGRRIAEAQVALARLEAAA